MLGLLKEETLSGKMMQIQCHPKKLNKKIGKLGVMGPGKMLLTYQY